MTQHSNNWGAHLLDQGASDVGTNGPYVKMFGDQVAKVCQVEPENVFLSNSGTSALELSLQQLKLTGPTTVVMPAMNFISAINVVKKANLPIDFVDINPSTLLMDLDKKLSDRCFRLKNHYKNVVIMPTMLYGAYDYDLDTDFNFNYIDGVIFDACEAFGSYVIKESIKSSKVFSCYSFNNNKIITTGAGGAIVSHAMNISDISNRNKQGSYYGIGENKGMASVNAELGYNAIFKGELNCNISHRRKIYHYYKKYLNDFVEFQDQGNGNFWMTFVMFPNLISKNAVINELNNNNIPFRLPFTTLQCFPNAARAHKLGLCLPSSPMLTISHQIQVIEIIKKAVEKYA